ncbi:glycine cleavage system protein R [Azospirillum picis]|uniref:Glycine cleavage system transcriptional repressor n=1 Tax=Azospirillum picis TaxID=488438 RepID=A0ABU0MTS4_9PROT|nr:amino acid-binding protein [Azospirillum picis]MBP2303139.1 glycine cleavage system transcriptional repressor [Azospirillum picis]MDQ0536891.1 glycine cleavage system transcriptional repressor [Azospirillum picis]
MTALALVSTFCPDRVGLVSGVTSHLFEQGINLRDATFASLGSGAEFSAVCELPEALTVADLQGSLSALPVLAGAEVKVTRFTYDPQPGPQVLVTHRVEVSGGDQPGLVARLSEIFTQFDANIVRLDAQTLPDRSGERYVLRFAVSIPPERADVCLSAVANTAETLALTCRVEGL